MHYDSGRLAGAFCLSLPTGPEPRTITLASAVTPGKEIASMSRQFVAVFILLFTSAHLPAGPQQPAGGITSPRAEFGFAAFRCG